MTPLVAGLRRPVVLLPLTRFTALSAARQRMTLCHELVHLKRWDLFLGWIPAAAEPLFFFHPLAHVAAREYLFWREAACDAAVLEALDVAPQEYGGLLLDLGVVGSRSSLAAAGAPWSFSILKRRIVMLRDPSSRSITTRALAPTLAVLALAAIAPLQLSARPATAATPPEAGTVATEAAAPDDVQSASTETRADKLNFVMFFDDNQTTMSGSVPRDINRAKSFRRAGEPMLWFRMSGREYVVRDPEVLREIENAWSGPNQVGAEQGDVGARQGRIGAKQGEIGAKQGEVGAEQAVIGSKQGAIGERQGRLAARESARSLTDAQQKEIDTERRALDDQMKELDREMRKLDDRMRDARRADARARRTDESPRQRNVGSRPPHGRGGEARGGADAGHPPPRDLERHRAGGEMTTGAGCTCDVRRATCYVLRARIMTGPSTTSTEVAAPVAGSNRILTASAPAGLKTRLPW